MIPFAKTLASCTAAILLIGTAGAESSFSVAFPYTPAASAAENYDGFKRTARRACLSEYRSVRSMSIRHHLLRACRAQLLDRVVDRVGTPEIVALHRPGTTPQPVRVLAQN